VVIGFVLMHVSPLHEYEVFNDNKFKTDFS